MAGIDFPSESLHACLLPFMFSLSAVVDESVSPDQGLNALATASFVKNIATDIVWKVA